jgi:hypothetical protein
MQGMAILLVLWTDQPTRRYRWYVEMELCWRVCLDAAETPTSMILVAGRERMKRR